MRYLVFLTGAAALTLAACSSLIRKSADANINTYWVNSSKVACTGEGARSCLQIKRGSDLESGNWEMFYSNIEGFDYEPGYLYFLRVKESPRPEPIPADASSIVYTLVEVVEKRLDAKLRLNDLWALERVGVEDIDAKDLPDGIELPTIEFQLAENRVGGTDGCNNFSGQLAEVGEETLTFGPLAMTKKMCQGSRVPDRVTSALNQVTTYKIDGLKLSLLNAAGAEILRYRKVD